MFFGSAVGVGRIEYGASSECLVFAFGVNDSLDGDSTSGAGVACGTCWGRKIPAHRSNSRQSKKDLASKYFGSSFASRRASLGSKLMLRAGAGSSTSSSTSVSSASSSMGANGLEKELSNSADLRESARAKHYISWSPFAYHFAAKYRHRSLHSTTARWSCVCSSSCCSGDNAIRKPFLCRLACHARLHRLLYPQANAGDVRPGMVCFYWFIPPRALKVVFWTVE